jgi:hypothetical protein
MAIALTSLSKVTLGSGATTLFTAIANTRVVVKRATFTNFGGAPVTISIGVTPSGGSSLAIILVQPIASSETFVSPEMAQLVLNAGTPSPGSAAWQRPATSSYPG